MIVEGVRRARAWQLSGETTVRAEILNPDGTKGPEIEVPIGSLLSPKTEIDMSTARQADRFWRIWNAIRSGKGSQLPPLIIRLGTRGTPVRALGWKY